jgi:archaellum component FlaF (FlaF/FlaG flagellin family)
MGFSVTIASSIIFIGIMVAFVSASTTIFYGFSEIHSAASDYIEQEKERLEVRVDLEVNTIDDRSVNITVENIGSKTIFLKSQNGFQWNTVVVSYANNSQWRSYNIEDYTISEISASGTNTTFDTTSHSFVNPGEEAIILFTVPEDAPNIPSDGVVVVVFVTHYGTVALKEAVR